MAAYYQVGTYSKDIISARDLWRRATERTKKGLPTADAHYVLNLKITPCPEAECRQIDHAKALQAAATRVIERLGGAIAVTGAECPSPGLRVNAGEKWGVEVNYSLGDRYSRRCTWRKREYVVAITIPQALVSAISNGARLETLDGMKTIHSLPQTGPGASRAWWVSLGRGYTLVAHSGWVVRDETGATAHAATRQDADRLLEKRHKAAARPTSSLPTPAERLQRRCTRLYRNRDRIVTLADSFEAGNCETGSLTWAARHAEGRATATIGEVVCAALTSGDQVDLALAACEQAVRSARTSSILAAA